MKSLTVALACLFAAAPAVAATDAAVEAPIRQFFTGFNTKDVPLAASAMSENVSIIDEIAPYHWVGKGAFAAWIEKEYANAKALEIKPGDVTFGNATREDVVGDHAYVVMPTTYTYTEKGVAMIRIAQMTFAMEKEKGGWKIRSWTWTGEPAKRVN